MEGCTTVGFNKLLNTTRTNLYKPTYLRKRRANDELRTNDSTFFNTTLFTHKPRFTNLELDLHGSHTNVHHSYGLSRKYTILFQVQCNRFTGGNNFITKKRQKHIGFAGVPLIWTRLTSTKLIISSLT